MPSSAWFSASTRSIGVRRYSSSVGCGSSMSQVSGRPGSSSCSTKPASTIARYSTAMRLGDAHRGTPRRVLVIGVLAPAERLEAADRDRGHERLLDAGGIGRRLRLATSRRSAVHAAIADRADAARTRRHARHHRRRIVELGELALLPALADDAHRLAGGGAGRRGGAGWRRPEAREPAENIGPPGRRDRMAARIGLPNSPSFGMSMPASSWSATTSATDRRSSACRAASSCAVSVGFDHASRSASGRGRLPAWVVRIAVGAASHSHTPLTRPETLLTLSGIASPRSATYQRAAGPIPAHAMKTIGRLLSAAVALPNVPVDPAHLSVLDWLWPPPITPVDRAIRKEGEPLRRAFPNIDFYNPGPRCSRSSGERSRR